MSKKGISETPIVFRVTEKDFESIDDWNRYVEYQEKLAESNKRSEFNRNASIEKTMRYLNEQEDKWKQLERFVDTQGIDHVLQVLTNPPMQSIDLNEIAARVAKMLGSKNMIKLDPGDEKGIEVSQENATKLLGLL